MMLTRVTVNTLCATFNQVLIIDGYGGRRILLYLAVLTKSIDDEFDEKNLY